MNLSPMRSISVAVLLTVTLLLASPSLMDRSGMKAATCVMNPVVINNADSGAGSLRQAILDACDGGVINFAGTVVSPITLASELAIDKNLTIQGPDANLLTISGNNAVRVFNIGSVSPGINVTLSGLTIANGNATLISAGPFFATGFFGGGIFNNCSGTLAVINSTISDNATDENGIFGGEGGGIFDNSTGTVNVTGTTISGNISKHGAGGGISNSVGGAVNVVNSIVSGNSGGVGGAISTNKGTVTISNSTVSDNTDGGILSIGGTVTVINSTFSNDTATLLGGGIGNFGGTLSVTSSTFSGNSATDTNPGDGAAGGCIHSQGGTVTLSDSTFSGNSAPIGSGISCLIVSNLTITNCTFSGNASTGSDFGVPGGCIATFFTPANITNSTISGNDTGAVNDGGRVSIKNTIIAMNRFYDVHFDFTSQGHNLIGNGDGGIGFTNGVNGDQVGSMASPLDPKLGPLQNNGGPTATMALLPGSPAIDAGDDLVLINPPFLSTDQRGLPRRSGLHVDIGAFEFQFLLDSCLKDSSTGNLFQFSSATGQYKFTRCSDGFMLSGTGVVRLVNGILTFTDSKPDRRVSAGFITSQRTGSATIYIMIAPGVWQTFRINSTNPSAVCQC